LIHFQETIKAAGFSPTAFINIEIDVSYMPLETIP
jgi:hypothetical protein